MTRLEVREQILDCRACELHKVGSGPIPFSGPTPSRVAILGEAPGKQEDKQGAPFVGPSGQLLREMLREAGFDDQTLFFFNATSCYPDGTPTSAHLNACAGNFTSQLELAAPEWVLVVGNTALTTIRPGVKVGRARRHVFRQRERMWMVTFHPSAALRNSNTEKVMRDDIAAFHHMVYDSHINEWGQQIMDWPQWEIRTCLGCGADDDDAEEHDLEMHVDDGLGTWCSDCTPLPFR